MTARRGSSRRASGTPNSAMISSPTNWLTMPPCVLDDGRGCGLDPAHQRFHLLGIGSLVERRVTREIREHHRGVTALAIVDGNRVVLEADRVRRNCRNAGRPESRRRTAGRLPNLHRKRHRTSRLGDSRPCSAGSACSEWKGPQQEATQYHLGLRLACVIARLPGFASSLRGSSDRCGGIDLRRHSSERQIKSPSARRASSPPAILSSLHPTSRSR